MFKMIVKHYFPTTGITFSKEKQNLSKFVASPSTTCLCSTSLVLLYKCTTVLLIRKGLRLAPNKAEKFLQGAEYLHL